MKFEILFQCPYCTGYLWLEYPDDIDEFQDGYYDYDTYHAVVDDETCEGAWELVGISNYRKSMV